eukprot:Hpha_TRINITY_DN17016_c2_g1::TRINITY_DN17016_c2_g1_i1::g.166751::m.166751
MSAPPQSRIVCRGCSTVLAYPVGAPSVRCPICEHISEIQQMRIQCTTCRTQLLLPLNTALALCPCCTTVMRVPGFRHPQQGPQQQRQQQHQQQAPPSPRVPKTMVYVENPPTMVGGKLVACVSVGTKVSGDAAAGS